VVSLSLEGDRHVMNSYLLSRIWFYILPVVFTGRDISKALLKSAADQVL
jgi:hypothetical protein